MGVAAPALDLGFHVVTFITEEIPLKGYSAKSMK
jgi:hypothetical protein